MAKYEIEHTCGCVETVNICGTNVHGERERKAAWLASKPCYKCQRKMDEAAGKAKSEPKDAKQAIFTEKNKQDFPKLLGFMRERLAGDNEVLAAVDEFEKACREHMDDFSICSSETLSNAIGEVWQMNYSRKYSGCKNNFVSVFRAAMAAAKKLDL